MKTVLPMKYPFPIIGIFAIMAILCLSMPQLHAQKIKKANQLFEQFAYPEAAEMYKKILSKSDNNEAKIKLAECYRLMNRPVEAEYWYEQVVELPESTDEHLLYYGMALKMNNNCEKAREQFVEYAQLVPADTRGLRLAESCDKEEYFRQDPGVYVLNNLNINSAKSDFGPAYYQDGLVFASDRGGKYQDKTYVWTEAPFLDLFYAAERAGTDPLEMDLPKLFKGDPNTWMHEGTVTFSKDEQTMFFTRNNFYKGKKKKDRENTINLRIFSSEYLGEKWGEIEDLPFNSDEYSCGHPTLSEDGSALYFVSDMPGGYGEEDIYVAYREGESWGNPINLGAEINTEGREMFPFISEDGTLYFSSDVLPGLGGLDVFSTSQKDDGSWSAPENLRAPLNTNYDDFGFILDPEGTSGYLASNRPGGQGSDDIYSFQRTAFQINGVVVDATTQEPIEGAIVQLIEGDVILQERTTYANGEFNFPISPNKNYEVRTFKPNYQDGLQAISTEDLMSSIDVKVPMTPDEYGGIHCELTGLIYEDPGGKPVEGATVKLINPITKFEKTYVTQEDGTYFFELDPETDYVIFATKEFYFTATKQVSTKGRDCASPLMKDLALDISLTKIELDESANDPNNPNNSYDPNNPNGTGGPGGAGVDGSSPTPGVLIPQKILDEFNVQHIYYDLDKAYIRPDAAVELDKIVALMYQNPGIQIELGSHTDSRGSDSYNLELSERRAQAAVDYIRSKGIANNRIVARGYGETQLVNRCGNGVDCSDAEHQENRRTEFKIIGYSTNAISSAPRYYGDGFGTVGGNDAESTYFDEPAESTPFDDEPATTTYTDNSSNNTTYEESTPFDEEPTYTNTSSSSSSTTSSSSGQYVGSASSADVYDPSSPTYFDSDEVRYDENGNPINALEFKIQLGAYKSPSLSRFSSLNDLGYIEIEPSNTSVQKVVLGKFVDKGFAYNILQQVRDRGYRDAFIVVYKDGVRQ